MMPEVLELFVEASRIYWTRPKLNPNWAWKPPRGRARLDVVDVKSSKPLKITRPYYAQARARIRAITAEIKANRPRIIINPHPIEPAFSIQRRSNGESRSIERGVGGLTRKP